MAIYNNTVARSFPSSKTVHGITVEKATVGKYITSMQAIQELPKQILEICYPNQGILEVLQQAKTADNAFIADLIGRLLFSAPEIVIALCLEFIDTDRGTLCSLSPDELLDVIEAWWGLNDLTNFLKRVWQKVKTLGLIQTLSSTLGSSDGSR